MISAAISTAVNTSLMRKPSATPIASSFASMKSPAHEAGSILGRGGNPGAITTLMRIARPILTRFGNCGRPVTGAVAISPRMRVKGQIKATSHASSCAEVTEIMLRLLSDHARNAREQPLRIVDQELQNPRAGDHHGDENADQLRNERERHLVDLCGRLENAHDEARHERSDEKRCGDDERQLQRLSDH